MGLTGYAFIRRTRITSLTYSQQERLQDPVTQRTYTCRGRRIKPVRLVAHDDHHSGGDPCEPQAQASLAISKL
jgi:hypothetical protein